MTRIERRETHGPAPQQKSNQKSSVIPFTQAWPHPWYQKRTPNARKESAFMTRLREAASVIVPALLAGLLLAPLLAPRADAAPLMRSALPSGGVPIERAQAAAADLNGVWSDGIAPIHIHQHGRDVDFRYVTSDYDHTFRGHFVSAYEIEGEYAPRRNRTTGCATTLAVHIDVRDVNTFVLHWRALDSNCDLTAGQAGTDAPYVRQSRPSWQAAPGDTSCCPNSMLVCPLGRHFCGH